MQSGGHEKQQPKPATDDSKADQRGTENSPFVVDTKGHRNTPQEAADEKTATERKDFIDTWTLRLTVANTAFTFLLMLAGVGGVILAIRTVRAIEREMELSHRPWVSIRPEVISPLTIEGNQFYLTIRFHFGNVGNSPAMKTMLVATIDPSWDGEQVDANWRSYYDQPNKPIASKIGFTLFPGASSHQDIGLSIGIDAGPSRIPEAPNLRNLTIMGRVEYEFSFAKGEHKTPFIYDLRRLQPGQPDALFLVDLGELKRDGSLPVKLSQHLPLSEGAPGAEAT